MSNLLSFSVPVFQQRSKKKKKKRKLNASKNRPPALSLGKVAWTARAASQTSAGQLRRAVQSQLRGGFNCIKKSLHPFSFFHPVPGSVCGNHARGKRRGRSSVRNKGDASRLLASEVLRRVEARAEPREE